MRFADPEHPFNAQHDRSLRAAELHELKVALQQNKDRQRAERKANSQPAGRHHLRLFVQRTSPSDS